MYDKYGDLTHVFHFHSDKTRGRISHIINVEEGTTILSTLQMAEITIGNTKYKVSPYEKKTSRLF